MTNTTVTWQFKASDCIPDEMVVPVKRVELMLHTQLKEIEEKLEGITVNVGGRKWIDAVDAIQALRTHITRDSKDV